MKLQFSLIIPVYNRPDEVNELLESLVSQTYNQSFEVIIVEDGSDQNSEEIVQKYQAILQGSDRQIRYFLKHNTGAGLSRNYGMQQATGNYFIILDSDILVPPNYLEIVYQRLSTYYTDFFGGPDAAHRSFTPVQKGINYAMTSLLTTGGLRGSKKPKIGFQPRSFNMGISKEAFEKSGGFSGRKIGEDIELSFTLKKLGYTSQLIPEAFVYHKRRSTFKQFFKQTFNFGKERPLLNRQFPGTAKITYWFPSLFMIGFLFATVLGLFNYYLPLLLFLLYFLAVLGSATVQYKNLKTGFLSLWATIVQFSGYGIGFLKSKFFS